MQKQIEMQNQQNHATLANWRTAPFNTWAFHHVREIVPTADIPNDADRPWKLPSRPEGGKKLKLDRFMEETHTDGLMVVHKGTVVFERYFNGMTPDTPHILMSVTKSMLGLLVGILQARGEFDVERQVTDVLPGLAGTAYKGASIRQVLDMRAGVKFDEDYLATSGTIIEYRKATGWNPLKPGDAPSDLHSFYSKLTQADGPHGGRFHYISPNTDLLGWLIERATGRRYADLMSELLWKPLGATRSAYITVDRLGAPRCAGGMCVTLADLALVGQLMVQGGRREGVQVIPEKWIDDLASGGDAAAWNAGSFVEYYPGLPMRYRSKWYALDGKMPMLSGMGIHGQNLYVDRANEIVIAKLSSQPLPLDAAQVATTTRAIDAIRSALAPIQ